MIERNQRPSLMDRRSDYYEECTTASKCGRDIELCVGRTSQGGGARNGLCATGGEIQWSHLAANGGRGLVTAPGCELGKLGFHRRDPRRERHGHSHPQALHAAVCAVLASHVGRTLPGGGAGGPGCATSAAPSFSHGGDRGQ